MLSHRFYSLAIGVSACFPSRYKVSVYSSVRSIFIILFKFAQRVNLIIIIIFLGLLNKNIIIIIILIFFIWVDLFFSFIGVVLSGKFTLG